MKMYRGMHEFTYLTPKTVFTLKEHGNLTSVKAEYFQIISNSSESLRKEYSFIVRVIVLFLEENKFTLHHHCLNFLNK